ncbi:MULTISPECIES: hypothetical protein [unclassified Streptomyces]|uniref:hypothetical protein n=1 Tax=unclassified Streptomyces TaxID=2593676 RepID=UPI00081B6D65|nr:MULTISPECIES: hypothetical protein [unclassified Streptomyces]MYQ87620.1 hypothetical protein [Streptomyces sp. SID4936]SCE48689.1 hypothetical protein GA0115234_1094236 [Streptomyces sp. DvalAA-43]
MARVPEGRAFAYFRPKAVRRNGAHLLPRNGQRWLSVASPVQCVDLGCRSIHWAHESGMILSRLGDLDAAEEHLHLALACRRTCAIGPADVRLCHGAIDGTMAFWSDFLDYADGIRSVKVQAVLHGYARRPEPVQRRPGGPKATGAGSPVRSLTHQSVIHTYAGHSR